MVLARAKPSKAFKSLLKPLLATESGALDGDPATASTTATTITKTNVEGMKIHWDSERVAGAMEIWWALAGSGWRQWRFSGALGE